MPTDATHPADRFRALRVPGTPLLSPNPRDAGSARLLASPGFAALATTSSGYAGRLGRWDGQGQPGRGAGACRRDRGDLAYHGCAARDSTPNARIRA
jgi:Phosphoenolpyruvate phosphomutase